MVEQHPANTTSVFISHAITTKPPIEAITTATFLWGELNPEDTFTIQHNDGLSVTYDIHQPGRPSEVRWIHDPIGTESVIEHLFGGELLDAMARAKDMGSFMIDIYLNEENRARIARSQLRSPSTPTSLREAAAAKLHEYEKQPHEAV